MTVESPRAFSHCSSASLTSHSAKHSGKHWGLASDGIRRQTIHSCTSSASPGALPGRSRSGMAHAQPESLHELETLLEFPPHVISEAELESRFQDLCKVVQKARDMFSCRVDEVEQQDNPFRELLVQLQKAKGRFHARLAASEAKNTKFFHGMRFKTMRGSTKDVNPFQELRDSFRMARKHFIPLIDQYISTGNTTYNDNIITDNNNNNSNSNSITQNNNRNRNVEPGAAQRLNGDPKSRQAGNAVHCSSSAIRSTMTTDYPSKPLPPPSNASNDHGTSARETKISSIELEADCCVVLSRASSPKGDADKMMHSISRPSNECKEMQSGAAAIRSVGENMVPCAGCSVPAHANQSPARRLGALVAKELQRRRGAEEEEEEGVSLQETEDLDHDDYRSIMPNSDVEVEAAGTLETTQHGLRGCAPNFFAKLKILDFYGGPDPTSPLESNAFHEMSSTGRETENDGAPAASV